MVCSVVARNPSGHPPPRDARSGGRCLVGGGGGERDPRRSPPSASSSWSRRSRGRGGDGSGGPRSRTRTSPSPRTNRRTAGPACQRRISVHKSTIGIRGRSPTPDFCSPSPVVPGLVMRSAAGGWRLAGGGWRLTGDGPRRPQQGGSRYINRRLVYAGVPQPPIFVAQVRSSRL